MWMRSCSAARNTRTKWFSVQTIGKVQKMIVHNNSDNMKYFWVQTKGRRRSSHWWCLWEVHTGYRAWEKTITDLVVNWTNIKWWTFSVIRCAFHTYQTNNVLVVAMDYLCWQWLTDNTSKKLASIIISMFCDDYNLWMPPLGPYLWKVHFVTRGKTWNFTLY